MAVICIMEARVRSFFGEVAACIDEIKCINLTLLGFQILGRGLQEFVAAPDGENVVGGASCSLAGTGSHKGTGDKSSSHSSEEQEDEDEEMDYSSSDCSASC